MSKQKIDVIFIVIVLFLLGLIRVFVFDLTPLNIIYGFIPSLLMGFIWLKYQDKFPLNLFISFISFFIVFDMRPWVFQWSSRLITALIALVFALAFTFLFMQQNKQDPLEGTTLLYFNRKFPSLNFFSLFLIDTLISGLILSALFMASVRKINLFHFIAAMTISGYYSATAVYFYLYLPSKETKKRKRKRKEPNK